MKVLFLCVANSARSQMAEGLAREILGPRVEVASGGSRPADLNPMAIEVMREVKVDISSHRSKSVDEFDAQVFDLVITLCAEEVCPVFLGKAKRLHWPLPDPALPQDSSELQLQLFRDTRDRLSKLLRNLKLEMTG